MQAQFAREPDAAGNGLMPIEITVEDPRWDDTRLSQHAQTSVKAALDRLKIDPEACEISILACDDTRISALNADFRGKARPTNVLSWPAEDLSPDIAGDAPNAPSADFAGEISLGDVALSYDTIAREAAENGVSFDNHVLHLIIHGLLHLLGYDHERDADATVMEGLETEILGTLGVKDPYNQD